MGGIPRKDGLAGGLLLALGVALVAIALYLQSSINQQEPGCSDACAMAELGVWALVVMAIPPLGAGIGILFGSNIARGIGAVLGVIYGAIFAVTAIGQMFPPAYSTPADPKVIILLVPLAAACIAATIITLVNTAPSGKG